MKKTSIQILALALVVCLCLSTTALASVDSSAYISATGAQISFSGNDVNIYFSIVGRHNMNEIGVSEIRLFEKNGSVWSRVYTFDSDDPTYTASMLSYNTSAKADYVTYSGSATKDYLAVLYFYAADNDGSDTITYYCYS